LIGLPLLFIIERENFPVRRMEPLSYLIENRLEAGVIFLALLTILLLVRRVLSI
jgi:hypothetical protein